MTHILDAIDSSAWAILPEALEQIIAIAERSNESPEVVSAKIGRPLVSARKVELRDDTAVIPVHGPIFRRANMFTEVSGATSIENLTNDFIQADVDNQVQRIILDIDSPGGQANGISELAAMIRNADKPVTAYVGGTGASAAYWLASAADHVVLSDTALVGSIGVVGTYRPGDKNEIKIISSQSPLSRISSLQA
ncbi:MAG: S49 family peptidase [Candidatus Thiodiazotropha sp. (ex Notomyrtea botanica)]|nr:S49 family peptidase [Candidatus Thiodiazotropha sp. (ex Notomyrtea botanica)]